MAAIVITLIILLGSLLAGGNKEKEEIMENMIYGVSKFKCPGEGRGTCSSCPARSENPSWPMNDGTLTIWCDYKNKVIPMK